MSGSVFGKTAGDSAAVYLAETPATPARAVSARKTAKAR
jgi:hypothetical protein